MKLLIQFTVIFFAYIIIYCRSFAPTNFVNKRIETIRNRLAINKRSTDVTFTVDVHVSVSVNIEKGNNAIVQYNNSIMLSLIANAINSSAGGTSSSFTITRRGNNKIKLPIYNENTAGSSEILFASNFTNTVHNINIYMSSKGRGDIPLQYFEFQWQNNNNDDCNNHPISSSIISSSSNDVKQISTNVGVLHLIQSLVAAENEEEINEALLNDFTTTDASNLSIGESYGIGCGFQIYLRGELVLTVGCGGGGGRYSNTHIECGGGGGASIFAPNSNIVARVGGGHGMQEGLENEHDATSYMEQLDKLRDSLTNANNNDIAILGGGGGGRGSHDNGINDNASNDGTGYGFGFEIGSIEAIRLAKNKMQRAKAGDDNEMNRNPLNLPEHLLNEDWAIQMAEYV